MLDINFHRFNFVKYIFAYNFFYSTVKCSNLPFCFQFPYKNVNKNCQICQRNTLLCPQSVKRIVNVLRCWCEQGYNWCRHRLRVITESKKAHQQLYLFQLFAAKCGHQDRRGLPHGITLPEWRISYINEYCIESHSVKNLFFQKKFSSSGPATDLFKKTHMHVCNGCSFREVNHGLTSTKKKRIYDWIYMKYGT